MSPAKQVLSHMESGRHTEKSGSPVNKSVQWDLVESKFEYDEDKEFGRKLVKTDQFKSVAEAMCLARYEPIQREELTTLK